MNMMLQYCLYTVLCTLSEEFSGAADKKMSRVWFQSHQYQQYVYGLSFDHLQNFQIGALLCVGV